MTTPLRTYDLSWPRHLDIKAVSAVFRALAADNRPGPVVLEALSVDGQLRHVLRLPRNRQQSLIRLLGVQVPGLRVEPSERPLPAVSHALKLKLSSRRRALRSDTPEQLSLGLLAALGNTQRGEALRLQWVLGPRLGPVAVPNNFVDFKRTSGLGAVLAVPFSPPARVDPEQRQALRDKQSLGGWRVVGRVGVTAASPARREQLIAGLLAALRVAESPALRLRSVATPAAALAEAVTPWLLWPFALNEVELVGLAAWPLGDVRLPGLVRSPFALQSAPPSVPQRGRVVGRVNYPGSSRSVALNKSDVARHLLLLGPTGVGKSTVMGQLALADAREGRGLILVDNRRDLLDDVLARLPEHRLDDVVVIDPSAAGDVVGFNPLAGPPEQAPLLADRLVSIFRQLYGDNLGPRSEDILHAGLLTLALYGGQTLPMLPLLFTHLGYRRRLTAGLDDPLGLGSFWSWFEGTSEAERRTATAPLMNKLRAVLLRPSLRRALGQTAPRFNVRQVFTERKILLVNLAKGDLGPETAQLFGALLLNEVWQQTLARATTPAHRRSLVTLHVDEFHEYLRLPTPLAEVLVAARGYGLGLTIATQHLAQLPADVLAAVLGNAGSRVAFRLSATDAKTMARDAVTLTPEDFQGLGAFEAYASLMAAGARTPYASITTLPFEPRLRNPETVRQAAGQRWGIPAADIDNELRALTEPTAAGAPGSPLGRRRRDGGSS